MSHEKPARAALLRFDPSLNLIDGGDKELRDGLSACVLAGDTLWVACDETTRIERLTGDPGGSFRDHRQFPLKQFLTLHAKEKEEADIEGMDVADGYLWLVGSHSLKRTKPKPGKSSDENRKRLAEVTSDGNRFLLARIPVADEGGVQTLSKETVEGGRRRVAAQLHGDALGSQLTAALREDEHLGRFFGIADKDDSKTPGKDDSKTKPRAGGAGIPGKDNGFDIEGLAVAGGRVFLGLRGPVLRGWATVLEVAVVDDDRHPSKLKLEGIGPGGRPYHKHFLDLGGLGVRDLCVDGKDLLILAGPAQDLDGPVAVFRWADWAEREEQSFVFADGLKKVLNVPFGEGFDHAESITLPPAGDGGRRPVMVLYDAPSAERKRGRPREAVLRADIFTLLG